MNNTQALFADYYLLDNLLAYYRKHGLSMAGLLLADLEQAWRAAENRHEIRGFTLSTRLEAQLHFERFMALRRNVEQCDEEGFVAILDAIEDDTSGDLDPRYSVAGQVLP